MERNVARIDGVKTHLHRLTDDELAGELVHAVGRVEQSQSDLETLQGELFRRFNVELPLGGVAIAASDSGWDDMGNYFEGDIQHIQQAE